MTMRDVMKHVKTVQERMDKRLGKLATLKSESGKSSQPAPAHKKVADAGDEREAMAHDADERTDRAEPCLKDGGPKRSEVC
jgi:hypothetical protein